MKKSIKQGLYYCPHCRQQSMRIDDKHGDYVCTICGIVSPVPVYDSTSEYRNFAIEHGVKDKSRSSYSGDDNGSSLGTSIQKTGSKESKLLFDATQRYTTDPKVAKLRKDLRRIQELANRLNLSKALARDAKNYFKEAQDRGLIKNQRKAAIDCVCIYFSCIKNHQSKRKEDIVAQAEDITMKDFNNVVKNFDIISPGAVSFAELAKQDAERLAYQPYIQDTIYAIGKKAEDISLFVGKTPDAVAAALVTFVNEFLTPDKQRTQQDILTSIGVTESTVQNHLKTLKNDKELDVYNIPKFKELLSKMKKA